MECATILFQFFFDFSLKHLNARLAFYNLFERLPFAVKTGNKQETNENTERTQSKDLFPAHTDGMAVQFLFNKG